jgi:phosphoheptose isomerase
MTSTYEFEVLDPKAPGRPAKFPNRRHEHAASYCDDYLKESARAASSIDLSKVERAAAVLLHTYTTGGNVFSCGNGGSAAVANHLQCDHVKGIQTGTDLLPRVMSLSSNVELLTAIANDLTFEHVFTYQLQSQARPGDVLIAISSSGRSPNIVRALTWAREHRLRTIALTGFSGGEAKQLAETAIHVDCENYGVIEDQHQAIMHAIAQYLRQSRMTEAAVAASTF